MNTWLLLVGGIMYVVILYQIWRGKTSISAGKESPALSVFRKTQPVAFWLIIAFQFILVTGLILLANYFLKV
jgi:cytochrome b subunit of formate dehydrogenase